MTVSTTTRKKSYTGNGSTTVFAYDFRIFSDSDLKVYVDSVLKSLTTHYTISGAGELTGGNVTFTSGNTPPDTKSVVIIRELPRTQTTDYVDNSALSATSLEDTADKNLMLIQEIDAKAGDGFRFADTVVDAGTITIDKNAADRGSKLLSFDAAGGLIATQEIGTSRGNWAASTSYQQRDIIKDTNNNNIYLCIVAHTSSGAVPISSNTDVAKWVLLVDAASATTSQAAAASSATASASSASTATAQAVIATAKAVLTASDATDTAADLVETAADVVLAEAAKVSAVAATGASAFKYTFDNATSMADPGSAGEIRFNHGTVGSVSALAIRATSADTGNPDISPFIASWDDGTNSAHEGYITIRKSGTPATYAVFSLTGAVVDNTAWLQLPVTHVSSNGTWSNADTMYISYARSGNVGATGPSGGVGNELADNVFRIQDNGDDTKEIAFEASGISSGTTRTITMPDANVTLVSSGSIANSDIDGSAAIATSKLSGAVTSISSHGLGALASLATVGNSQIDNNAVDEDKLKDALIPDFTEVTVATGDSIVFGDATDSGNTKRDTVQGVIDLVHGATVGVQTIWVPAMAMKPTDSNGCSDLETVETTSGRPDMNVLDFDDGSDEHAQFQIAFPKSWNAGTVTFQVYWCSTATDTDGVSWGLQGVSVPDNSTIDVAYGTAVVVDDANQGAAEEQLVTAVSTAVTIASAADDCLTYFRIFRDVSDANDTATEDARLLGCKIFFTTDAENDA